jgi:hypothetical protein
MRFKRGYYGYLEFVRPNPSRRDSFIQTECECGIEPATHFHKVYKERKR